MLIRNTQLTAALAAWLKEARDDDSPQLALTQEGSNIRVLRADGSELSATERLEVEALLAAHLVAPLKR